MSVSELDNQLYSTEKLVVPLGVGIASNSSPSLTPSAGSLAQDVTQPGSLYVGTGTTWRSSSVSPTPPTVVTGISLTSGSGQPPFTNCTLVLQTVGTGTNAQKLMTLIVDQQITSAAAGLTTWNTPSAVIPTAFLPINANPINVSGVATTGASTLTTAYFSISQTGFLSVTLTAPASPQLLSLSELVTNYI